MAAFTSRLTDSHPHLIRCLYSLSPLPTPLFTFFLILLSVFLILIIFDTGAFFTILSKFVPYCPSHSPSFPGGTTVTPSYSLGPHSPPTTTHSSRSFNHRICFFISAISLSLLDPFEFLDLSTFRPLRPFHFNLTYSSNKSAVA